MKKKLLIYSIVILVLLITLIFGSCHNNISTPTEDRAEIVVNNLDEDIQVLLGFHDQVSSEIELGVLKPKSNVNAEKLLIPITKTDYLISAINTKSIVVYAQRLPPDFFQNTWNLNIAQGVYSNEHSLVIQNDSSENLVIYTGIWNGSSYFASKIGSVPANSEKTFPYSNIDNIPNYYFRIMAISETKQTMIYSHWFSADELDQANWKIILPNIRFGLWDAVVNLTISNRTNEELDIFVYTGNEIWKRKEEGNYIRLGSVAANSDLKANGFQVSGQFGWQYLYVIEAHNSKGITTFHQLLTPTQLNELKNVISIDNNTN